MNPSKDLHQAGACRGRLRRAISAEVKACLLQDETEYYLKTAIYE